MSPKIVILISVLLSGAAQIFLKQGMNQVLKRQNKGVFGLVLSVCSQPFVWMWGFSFVIATALWLVGLQKVDLSYAYPLVSMGYVLVAVLAMLILKERINRDRWMAIAVFGVGVLLIASS